MSAYLDASVLVPLFLADVFSLQAEALVASEPTLLVSDWAVVEVSAVIARQARMGTLTWQDAQAAFAAFDQWRAAMAGSVAAIEADMQAAALFVRRPGLALRGPDALHIALCARLGATLLTFDGRLAAAASALGVATAP